MADVKVDYDNVATPEGLQQLDRYLSYHSFIGGDKGVTTDDIAVFRKVGGSYNPEDLVNVDRWHRHVASWVDNPPADLPKGDFPLEEAVDEEDEEDVEDEEDEEDVEDEDGEDDSEAPPRRENEIGDEEEKNDDDVDLFGEEDEEEDDSALKEKMEALKASKEKKREAAKSSLVIHIEPANVDTDLDYVLELVKGLKIEGVTWGATATKIPLAYGIQKLQVSCTIVDDIVNTNEITEMIEELGLTEKQKEERRQRIEEGLDQYESDSDDEDLVGFVQSATIVSFNKL